MELVLQPKHVQLLIDQAQNAPLQNMKHAAAVGEALQILKGHFEDHFNGAAHAAACAASADHDPADLPMAGSPLPESPPT